MRQIKIQLDEKIEEKLMEKADKIGLKLTTYIQMILGQHAAEAEKQAD